MFEATTGTPEATGGFQIRWVFGRMTAAMRRQLVEFWLHEGALESPDEAWRRSWEAACLLQEQTGKVAGVCTVAIGLDDHQRAYGYLRIFVAAANRRPGLNVRMVRKVVEGFECLATEPGAPQRLVATVENPKIARRGGLRLLASVGFQSIGRTERGELLIERPLAGQVTSTTA